jgi:hypothetical protein
MAQYSKSKLVVRLVAWISVIAPAVALHAAAPTSYHIGNSLTHDTAPWGLEKLAQQRGLSHTDGYHIRSGASLNNMLYFPSTVSIEPPAPFGPLTSALPNYKWNAVAIQPHTGPNSTLATDITSIEWIIDLARTNPENAGTRFYVISTWPTLGDYGAQWTYPSPDSLDTPTNRTRDYFTHLVDRLRVETDANVLMVPIGDVLYELNERLGAHAVAGYSSVIPFYRDGHHLSSLGQYAALLTTYVTIRGEFPSGLSKPAGVFTFDSEPPNAAEIYALINQTVHDVVGSHSYSGVEFLPPPRADFDANGIVDQLDLQMLSRSLGKSSVADANGDGAVDDQDRAIWHREVGLSSRNTSDLKPTDVDRDGVTDSRDLNIWRQSFGVNAGYDTDRDGDSDGHDFLEWQRGVTESFSADFNNDYVVDARDFNIWQLNDGFTIHADANGDGMVNQDDFLIWQEEEGRVWPPLPIFPDVAPVPEPGASWLAALASGLWAHGWLAQGRRQQA